MPYQLQTNNIDLLSEDSVKKYVLPAYGINNCEVSQIKFKDTDKQRAVYKVVYEDNIYCLKKVYFDEKDLLFVYSATEWLFRSGIHVPKMLPSCDRKRYVIFEDMLFILTPWIDGTKFDYDNIEHVIEASTNLAVMHKSCKNFKPIMGSNIRTGLDDSYSSVKKHFEQLLICSNQAFKYKDKFSRLFLEKFDSNLILAQTACQIAAKMNIDNLSKSLCHMDYVNKNIIFDNENTLWVIDFDKCRIDYSAHDISYFLRRFLRRDMTRWNFEIAISSLNAYDKVNTLTLDDYRYILVYLAFPQKYWKISRDYYNNIQKCNKNSFYNLLVKSTEKTEYHIQFIENFIKFVEDKYDIKL